MNVAAVRLVIPLLALAAGGAAAFIFGIHQTRQILGVSTQLMATAPSAPAIPAQDQHNTTPAKAQTETAALTDALAGPAPAPGSDAVPEFDVVNIEPTGETVVAGRALPGATVELLRNGEVHDRAVADQSGQFVMVPRPLPPGNYDLTLRMTRDGKQVTSKQSVAVALEAAARERPMVALMAPDKAIRVLSQPATTAPAAGKTAVDAVTSTASIPAPAAATTAASNSPSVVTAPKGMMTTVSRGDSLWRLSQRAFGAGQRYAVIYRANMQRIRNPNLIYPGQVFVVPAK